MDKISTGKVSAYADMLLLDADGQPLIISYFDRSAQVVRSVGGELIWNKKFFYRHQIRKYEAGYTVNYGAIVEGKERFTHAIAVAIDLSDKYLVTTEQDLYADLYNMLMLKYDYPLLERWIPEIYKCMVRERCLSNGYKKRIIGNQEHHIMKNGKEILLKDLLFFKLDMTNDKLEEMIATLLRKGSIWISKTPQNALHIENMDSYFQLYGKSIVDNLRSILHPIAELNGEITRAALKKTRLYPQQAAMVNGVYEYLRTGKKRALFVMATGTGKTIQAAAEVEMYYVGRWLEQHPGKSLSDAYAEPGLINYRHIVMCPGHIAGKWAKEIKKEIPYAKATIINEFSQLVQLEKDGIERKNGREFYIISKDFCKLSYQRIPAVRKEAYKQVYAYKCKSCGTIQRRRNSKCPTCGSQDHELVPTRHMRCGLVCPNCNHLAYSEKFVYEEDMMSDLYAKTTLPLQWYDMVTEKDSNQRCYYCGEELWQPYIKNLNTVFGRSRKAVWHNMTFYRNMAKKGRVTYWVMYGKEAEAEKLFGKSIADLGCSGGCRKYSPALYIKKKLKGYFDFFIADELHKAKGGSTAQGNAFHCIMKASRITLGLTGTIAGGVATDLFYLLYRMFPSKMKKHGYEWGSVMAFVRDYGCIGTYFTPVGGDAFHGKLSRGRQMQAPKVLPGISPLIFSEFLLDCAVFLNLVDMSANLPPLYEQIALVEPLSDLEDQMMKDYRKVIQVVKDYEHHTHVNMMSVRNQFSLSYLDHPYGVPPILNPETGSEVCEPMDYHMLIEGDAMLAKEAKLVEIVKEELGNNRNCVVYVEYSQDASSNVLFRLQELLCRECGLEEQEVIVMQSGYPSALKREEWMHDRAREGMRVMICNPRLCETGLDFCWEEEGKVYNYPNLIFYQIGYSLFVVWQAAGRAWRLNQREECHTYYLAYKHTVQQAILQVLGEKKAATSAIQGKFSADGLAAMAQGVDTQVRIAQIMSEMDEESGNRLQEMFDVLGNVTDDEYAKCERMKLFNELVKNVDVEYPDDLANLQKTLMGMGMMMGFGNNTGLNHVAEENPLSPMMNLFAMNQNLLAASGLSREAPVSQKKKRRKVRVYEDCSIFG